MDLEPGKKGGTWLGITTDGKFAAVTNYRQAPKFIDPKARGRGHLVPDFLKGSGDVQSYLEAVGSEGDKYNGFNLLVGKLSQNGETKIGWYCNVEDKQITMLEPGIHVLSNKVLNCFWPKMAYGRERFAEILEETSTKEELVDKLMGLLSTRQRLVNLQSLKFVLPSVLSTYYYMPGSANGQDKVDPVFGLATCAEKMGPFYAPRISLFDPMSKKESEVDLQNVMGV